ncbi:MAG: ATP-binding cassette domain-containing protein [Rickettsiales bacterium]|nr:ATP-binding cassette domain-containing protein [Rickettsiales bacterium]
MKENTKVRVRDLNINYGDFVLMKNLNFTINEKDIFIIMGESGCGKSSLLKILTGLKEPDVGDVFVNGVNFYKTDENTRDEIMRNNGVLYQSGALFSSMTLAENVAMPLQQWTSYSKDEIDDITHFKLSLVGLGNFENFYPEEISGGMKKRAGLARALALDPKIVYFDEPSAGLDPVSSRSLDDLILKINETLGTTMVVVTHELSSIFTVGTNSIFLDVNTKSILATGNPKEILNNTNSETVLKFLTRSNNE